MKKKSTNPKMAMMMGRAMRRPALAVNPEVAQPAVNPMAAMAAAPQGMPGMKKGGMMKSDMKEDTKMDKAQDKVMIKKAFGMHDKQEHKGEHTDLSKLKKGGMAPDARSIKEATTADKNSKFGESAVQKRGHTRGTNLGDSGKTLAPKQMCKGGYAKGGSASSRADGIAVKGKTRGKMC